jgi:hypothetical protein
MKDDLKNKKMHFLSNHWVDLNKIGDSSSGDQNKSDLRFLLKMTSTKTNFINDYLKNLKLSFLINH